MADVQGAGITRSSLEHWTDIMRAAAQTSATPTPVSPARLREKALAFLITAQWLQQEASAQHVIVSPAEVDAIYRRLSRGLAGNVFIATMKQRGMSSADEKLQLLVAQLTIKLQRKVMSGPTRITGAEIASYYDAHPGRYEHRGQTLQVAAPEIRGILDQARMRERISAFVAAYRLRWKQRTTCRAGYVIAECRNGPAL